MQGRFGLFAIASIIALSVGTCSPEGAVSPTVDSLSTESTPNATEDHTIPDILANPTYIPTVEGPIVLDPEKFIPSDDAPGCFEPIDPPVGSADQCFEPDPTYVEGYVGLCEDPTTIADCAGNLEKR